MEEQYKLYDKVVSTTLVNFMVEDNRNKGVVLSPFNPNDAESLYAFEVALLLSQSIGRVFYLDMGFFAYWKFRFKNWSMRKTFKRYTTANKEIKMELDNILSFIRNELSLDKDIYEKIYKEYYEKGTKNRSIYRWKHQK